MLGSFYLFGYKFYSYPLVLGFVWTFAYQYSQAYFDKKKLPSFNFFFFSVFILSWTGAKLLFLLTSEERLVLEIFDTTTFWLGGGFVFYGGFLSAMAAVFFYVFHYKIEIKKLSFLVPLLAFSHGMGRLACLLAGCCFGKVTNSSLGIHMHGAFRHPVQVYESILLIGLGFFLYKRERAGKSVLLEYVLGYACLRFALEFLRGDKVRGIYFYSLSTSQMISILLASFILVRMIKLRIITPKF